MDRGGWEGLFFSGTFFSAGEGHDPLRSTLKRKAPVAGAKTSVESLQTEP